MNNKHHDAYAAQHRAALNKAGRLTAGNLRLFQRMRVARDSCVYGIDELRAIAGALLDLIGSEEELAFLLAVWNMPTLTGMRELIATMSADDLTRFVLDCTVLEHCVASPYGKAVEPQALFDACALYGVDAAAVLAEADPAGAAAFEGAEA